MDALRRGQERLKSARFFLHKVHGVARHRVKMGVRLYRRVARGARTRSDTLGARSERSTFV
eukprot:6761267-Prymnesium_polylepis.1